MTSRSSILAQSIAPHLLRHTLVFGGILVAGFVCIHAILLAFNIAAFDLGIYTNFSPDDESTPYEAASLPYYVISLLQTDPRAWLALLFFMPFAFVLLLGTYRLLRSRPTVLFGLVLFRESFQKAQYLHPHFIRLLLSFLHSRASLESPRDEIFTRQRTFLILRRVGSVTAS